jgi:mannose-1-phosphate guanylyltransferase
LLKRHRFEDVIANLHYFPELIKEAFGDGSDYGIELSYSFEGELLGTAGGVRNVRDFLGDETFLIISGDALTDIDLEALWRRHREAGGIGTLSLKRVPDPTQLGVVIVDDDGRIQGFQEKPAPGEELSNLGNCGIYVFEPEIFDYFPDRPFVDWAQDVFPVLLDQGVPLYGHEIEGYWNDVGSIQELRQGNFDALTGAVELELPGTESRDGLRLGDTAEVDAGLVTDPPVFVGDGSRVGADVRLDGPVVIGERCTIGKGARLRDVVVLPGSDVPEHAMLVGGIAGQRPLIDALR